MIVDENSFFGWGEFASIAGCGENRERMEVWVTSGFLLNRTRWSLCYYLHEKSAVHEVFVKLLFHVATIIGDRNVGWIELLSAATFSEDGFPVTVFDHSEMRAMGERFHGCGLSHEKTARVIGRKALPGQIAMLNQWLRECNDEMRAHPELSERSAGSKKRRFTIKSRSRDHYEAVRNMDDFRQKFGKLFKKSSPQMEVTFAR